MSVCFLAAGILLINLGTKDNAGEFYTFPLSVGEKTYVVTVRSNYSSAPTITYSELHKAVLVDFTGEKENAFCNITIPKNLIWGNISVIDKIYEMNPSNYILNSNSTYNSVYFTFDHPALVKHFEIVGTQGI
ncbi:MAG: hypothetical protein NWF01_06780 [Candidatus Bathyarchaeota archaeon]|nr:hypothetical protein [Candidatus Bathyarchaeota archaeon]